MYSTVHRLKSVFQNATLTIMNQQSFRKLITPVHHGNSISITIQVVNVETNFTELSFVTTISRLYTLLLTCHCMSYSNYGDMILVGTCMYLCTYNPYTKVSINTDLNNLCNSVVQQNYRKRQMCGKCLDNHSPAPYTLTD